jgi:hypothetical protein
MVIENGPHRYHVGARVAETPEYRLYLCSAEEGGSGQLLQIACEVPTNGTLDRSAYFLEQLLARAEELESKYAKVKSNPDAQLNYQLGFPALVDSFVPVDQGGRRVNVLAFRHVEDTRAMVPLHNIVHRDRQRIDLRSSIWILGKLLKTIAFAHGADVTINQVTPGNVLIDPSQHYVVVFNWANAQKHPEGIPRNEVMGEIKAAVSTVLTALDGTEEGGIPDDDSDQYQQYNEHVMGLLRTGHRSAKDAHREFYELVDQLWPRGFHPFTTQTRSKEN